MNHRKPLRNADFLVVGAGAVGLSTAWGLARKSGASVIVVDRREAGREASWAGGGMLFPLNPWNYAGAVTSLTELGRNLYPAWTAELQATSGIDPEYRQTGAFMLPPIDFSRAQAWCAEQNIRARTVRGANIPPVLAEKNEALWLPDIAQVRNPRLLESLALTLRSCGATIQEGVEIIGIEVEENRVVGVTTADGTISAGAVIICAGAWSKRLLGPYAASVNIFPVRGQMLLYQMPPNTLDAMVIKEGCYLIPRADGHILAGSTLEHAGFDKTTTVAAAQDLHNAAGKILPLLTEIQPIKHWAGLRPGSIDNIPVIGRHPTIENLYLNSGHFRYGLTMAPASAQILINLILGLPQPLDVTPYEWPTTWREKPSENKLDKVKSAF